MRRVAIAAWPCSVLAGELGVPDLLAAVECAAVEITGSAQARVVLGAGPAGPPSGEPEPSSAALHLPIDCRGESFGTLEVSGLQRPLSDDARLGLDLLASQAGVSLATARTRALQDAEAGKRAKVEEGLRASLAEKRLPAELSDRAPVGVHSVDADGVFLKINATELGWLGYAREEVVGRLRVADVCTPASRVLVEEALLRIQQSGSVRNLELEVVRKDGSLLPVLASATAVYDSGGQFAFSRWLVVERTGRRTEEKLRERERFIQRIAEATPDLLYVLDLETGHSVYANRELTRALGYTRVDLDALGPNLFATLLHPDDFARLSERMARFRSAKDEDVVETEYRIRDSSGAWRWLHSRDVVFARDPRGRPTQVLGVAKDVTDRKEAQLALAKSEGFYRTLVQTLPGGVAIFDEEDRLTWASRTLFELFRVPSEAGLVGTPVLDLVAPESIPFMTERRRTLHEERTSAAPAEICFLRRDGSTFWGVGSASPLFEPDGRLSGSVSFIVDASEKHRAEEELGRHERFIESIFHATPDAMYVFDLDTRRIVFANRDLPSLVGYPKEEAEAMGGELLPALLHPDDLDLYETGVARLEKASDDDVVETHFRVRHRDGTWRWMHGRGIVFERSANGRPARILAVVKDVTAQKEAEDALRESEAFHRALTETVPVGITMTDEDERITWASPAFRELLGVSYAQDVAGTRLSEWASLDSEGAVQERRRAPRVFDGPVPPREVRLRRTDGTDRWVDIASTPLFHADGRFRGAIVAARDVTERRGAAEALKASAERLQHLSRRVVEVQEEERRHIARELHDEIGQSLAAIFFRLGAFLQSREPAPRSLVEESMEIADRTIQVVRDLSLDLHPSLLDEAGLADTLRWYVDRQVRGPGLDVSIEVSPTLVALSPDLRIALFRIAQSALTNVVRHARARTVRVEAGRREDVLELVVRDDGVGFDVAETLPRASSGTSLGLLGMRERAELVGGTIEFDSAPGKGTTVTARFPLPSNDVDIEEVP